MSYFTILILKQKDIQKAKKELFSKSFGRKFSFNYVLNVPKEERLREEKFFLNTKSFTNQKSGYVIIDIESFDSSFAQFQPSKRKLAKLKTKLSQKEFDKYQENLNYEISQTNLEEKKYLFNFLKNLKENQIEFGFGYFQDSKNWKGFDEENYVDIFPEILKENVIYFLK